MPTLDTIHDYLAAHSDEVGQCILFASTAMPTSRTLVRDTQQKKKVLDVLESATRGLRRMEEIVIQHRAPRSTRP